MEERNNDIKPPMNSFMNPGNGNERPHMEMSDNISNKIPSNIGMQQPEILKEKLLMDDIQENFEKYQSKQSLNNDHNNNNNNIEDDEDLIVSSNNKGIISKITNYFNNILSLFDSLSYTSILYTFIILTISYYIFHCVELDLIMTATLSYYSKNDLTDFRLIIGACTYAIYISQIYAFLL